MSRPPLFGKGSSALWSKLGIRLLWIVAIGYLVLMAVAAGIAAWSASPTTCSSCHEIKHAVDLWKISPHAQIGCPSCHEPVRPLYRLPEMFVWRAQMLLRDINAHRANPNASQLTTAQANLRPVPDQNCLQCHDLTRQVTLPPGLVMDHAKHVARNKSCISCHYSTAHPPPDTEKAILLMQRCFNCHGSQSGAKAPGACTECHPKDFSQRPASHSPSYAWLQHHGKAALANKQPCFMCHRETFCTNCHGLNMPHPANWAKGNPPLHAQFAQTNSQVCVQCHGAAPNLCSMCHHQGFNPNNGPWASNHAATVSERGASFCLGCHDELFCNGCHGRPGGPKAPGAAPTATPTATPAPTQ